VNPHINLFFFSSRGAVGRPVTHRKGRGWRGGFLGSAVEQYIKLDLNKWLRVLRHLELLPRPLGQDWSQIWLQHFSGTITIWPKSVPSDFWNILSDPSPQRLARMIRMGQRSAFPKIQFIRNRMKIERCIMEGLLRNSPSGGRDLSPLLSRRVEVGNKEVPGDVVKDEEANGALRERRNVSGHESKSKYLDVPAGAAPGHQQRRSSVLEEISRQSAVFFDDSDVYGEEANMYSSDEGSLIAAENSGTRVD
jgi:hypothetical protein